MNCPKDRSPLIVVEHDKIALDYCTTCRGVWFDRGELELITERACGPQSEICMADIMNRPDAVTDEEKRRCPICNRRMLKKNIGAAPPVLIDACDQGDGLWFDGGEVQQFLSQMKTPDSNVTDAGLLAFLKEILKADIGK